MPLIHCADCDSVYEARRANAKYCPFCRMYRDWVYAVGHGRVKKCAVCEEEFWPIPIQSKVCPNCEPHPASHGRGECGICHRDDQPFHTKGVKLCVHCIQSTAKKTRKEVRDSMRYKSKYMKEHPYTDPRQWEVTR